MNDSIEKTENPYDEIHKDYILTELEERRFRGRLFGFYLRNKDMDLNRSTLILFSPEGIVICGDLCPGDSGVISGVYHDLNWFLKIDDEDYLLSKFHINKSFFPLTAFSELSSYFEDIFGEKDWAKKHPDEYNLLSKLEDGELDNEHDLDECLYDLDCNYVYDAPNGRWGYSYNTLHAHLLISIHKTFIRLYKGEHGTSS